MSFFKQFPKIPYDFNRNGVITNVVNIYRSVRPVQNFIDDTSSYTFYNIINGEKWYVTSANLANFFFLQALVPIQNILS